MGDRSELLELWKELNRPGASRFAAELRRRGYRASVQDARDIIELSAAKQRFAPGPRYRGNVVARAQDERWAADFAVFDAPSAEGRRHVLVVQDLFTRFAWAEQVPDPIVKNAAAFRRILGRAGERRPLSLTVDDDPAFKTTAFQEAAGAAVLVKSGRNDIATVDSLIGVLKRALAEEAMETGRGDWDDRTLQRVVAGRNKSSHPALMGEAPKDVPDNDVLKFLLAKRGDQAAAQNNDLLEKRAERLREKGGFRTLVKTDGRMRRRVFTPRWSEKVRRVGKVELGHVTDADTGESFPTKEVLPVAFETGDAPAPAPTTRSAAGERLRLKLEPFARRVGEYLEERPGRSAPVSSLARVVDTTALRRALTDGGRSAESPFARLAQAFPERLAMRTSGRGGAATMVLL